MRSSRSSSRSGAMILIALALSAAPTTAAPNLVVRIEGEPVPSSHEQMLSDTRVGASTQLIVVLRNEGDEDLVFSETPPISLGGGFPDQFVLIQPALETGNKLSPNGSTAFAIRLEPTFRFASLWTRAFVFTNASAAPFSLGVRGKATAPVLAVSQNGASVADGASVDLSSLASGGTSQLVFVLRNTGDATLHFVGDPLVDVDGPDARLFVVDQPALETGNTLSPNGSTAFAIRLSQALTANRTLDATLTIQTDDLDGAFEMMIVGDAVGAGLSSWGAVKARY